MKFVALVSGGKDSYYAAYEAIRNGHELICCAHLAPPPPPPLKEKEEEEEESYMYQSAASEAVETQVTKCLQIPFYKRVRKGKSVQVGLVYDHTTTTTTLKKKEEEEEDEKVGDEVEDLYHLLRTVLASHPDITAVSSGAILSTYQRTRVESVCSRLSLTSLSYLWRGILHSQRILLQTMIETDKFEFVLVKCASPPGLNPRLHLGKSARELLENGTLDTLHAKYDFHVCGEGGEYESLVLDCPLFKRRLVLDETRIELEETDDGVGVLKVLKCSSLEKDQGEEEEVWDLKNVCGVKEPLLPERMQMILNKNEMMDGRRTFESNCAIDEKKKRDTVESSSKLQQTRETSSSLDPSPPPPSPPPQPQPTPPTLLPRVRQVSGGLYHLSEIMSSSLLPPQPLPPFKTLPSQDEKEKQQAQVAVYEFQSILLQLNHLLSHLPSSLHTNQISNYSSFSTKITLKEEKEEKVVVVKCTPKDVIYVHLYLANMSQFAFINKHYQDYFGSVLPPSRSCVSIGLNVLPGGRSVCLDCMVLRGSGNYMRPPPPPLSALKSSIKDDGDDDEEEEEDQSAKEDEYVRLARLNPHHKLRSTLHVQSISHWAPVCVGPYSQANIIRGGIICLAGQIGLEPNCMKLISSSSSSDDNDEGKRGWEMELQQSWKNAARVLDALCEDSSSGGGGSTLNDCLGGLVYITSSVLSSEKGEEKEEERENKTWWKSAEQICNQALKSNGGVQVGSVDGTRGLGSGSGAGSGAVGGIYTGEKEETDDELNGGYEDEETWREIEGDDVVDAILAKKNNKKVYGEKKNDEDEDVKHYKPLLMVCIPQMPVGASAEVELVCVTQRASSCLGGVCNFAACITTEEEEKDKMTSIEHKNSANTNGIQWDTGYNNNYNNSASMPSSSSSSVSSLHLQSDVAYIGHGCAAMAYVSASSLLDSSEALPLSCSMEQVLDSMVSRAITLLTKHAGLDALRSVLNIRLYHVVNPHATTNNNKIFDDSMGLRYALHSVLGSWFGGGGGGGKLVPPACTVVPVRALRLRTSFSSLKKSTKNDHPYDDDEEEEESMSGFIAMQVFAADPLHMETEMWIHHGRTYNL